ncbi:MAG: hypothetical protein AB7O84_21965 [Planctomycetota bacterium]
MAGPKITKLIEVLDELALVLRDLDHGHWSEWMAESAQRLRHDDFSGVTHLLRAYGGMGSFNDALPELAGGPADDQVDRARSLRSEAWELAEAVRREVDRGRLSN